MKKMFILLGLIVTVVTAGIPVAHALGPRVTRVTPYSGIPKYAHMNEVYTGELTAGAWGIESSSHGVIGKSVISAIIESTGKAVDKTVGLAVGPAKLKMIAAVAVQAGLLVGMDYFGDWLQNHGWEWFENQVQEATVEPDLPSGAVYWVLEENYASAGIGNLTWERPGWPGQSLHIETFMLTHGGCMSAGYSINQYSISTFGGWNTSAWAMFQREGIGPGKNVACCVYPTSQGGQSWLLEVNGQNFPGGHEPVAEADVQTAVQTDLEANDETAKKIAQGAMAAVAPSVNSANTNWPAAAADYSSTPIGSTAGSTVQTALDESISEDQTSEVTEGGSRTASDTDWEYTPEEMARAQYDMDKQLDKDRRAEYDNQSVTALGDPDEPAPPDKDSITEKLESFVDGISTGGVMSYLDSMKDTQLSEANCAFSVDCGEWGIVEFTFCPWQGPLSTLGTIMLGFCTFIWTMWFFMGRGDA